MVSKRKQEQINNKTTHCECCKKEIIDFGRTKYCSFCGVYIRDLKHKKTQYKTERNLLRETLWKLGYNLKGKK